MSPNQRPKAIGIIGTGSSGVQSIPELAKVAAHLTVFQRTPTFTWPSRNKPLTDEEQAAVKSRYREFRKEQKASFSGTAGTSAAIGQTRRQPSGQRPPARGSRGGGVRPLAEAALGAWKMRDLGKHRGRGNNGEPASDKRLPPSERAAPPTSTRG